MRYKAVGFDMDGTLIDSYIDYEKLGNAGHDVLSELGVPDDKMDHRSEKYLVMSGVSYLRSIGEEYTFNEIAAMISERDNEIEMENVEKSVLFPGVMDVLKDLKSKGLMIGLLTRGQRAYAVRSLRLCGIEYLFDALEAFDDHQLGEQKPNPMAMKHLGDKLNVLPKDILYVGDSPTDYYCARDSGAGFIGVAFDERHEKMWKELDDRIKTIKNIDEILLIFIDELPKHNF